MDWDVLRFFLAVTRSGSLAGAAAALEVSSATVARRIEALEQALGVTCFVRLPSGYEITQSGRALLVDAEAAEAAISALIGRHKDDDNRVIGSVRLAVPPEFAEYLLVPRLPALLARYPGLQLDIATGTDVVDINRMEADVAFRSIRPERGERTRVRRLADFPFGLYGALEFAERHWAGGPIPANLPLITRTPAMERLAAQRWIMEALSSAKVVLRITTLREAVAACRLGLGATVLPRFVAEGEPDLVPIGQDPAFWVAKWLVIHSGAVKTSRIRAVVEWLVEEFPYRKTERENGGA